MRTIGMLAGANVTGLGPVADVQLFFDCVAAFGGVDTPGEDWTLITDRLYRRYLRREELAPAEELMNTLKLRFAARPSSAVDWGEIAAPGATTRLDPSRPSLADVFACYFAAFDESKEAAGIFYRDWGRYDPLRIVVADLPDLINAKERPLAAYDMLEGEPFWKR
jgi:hypothetical protein